MSIHDDLTPLPIDNPTLYRRCREAGPSGSLDLTERLVRGADLRTVPLPELYAPLARFEGVRFDGEQLCHAFLHSAVFIDCDLSTVNIGGGAVSVDAQRGVRWPVGFTPD